MDSDNAASAKLRGTTSFLELTYASYLQYQKFFQHLTLSNATYTFLKLYIDSWSSCKSYVRIVFIVNPFP